MHANACLSGLRISPNFMRKFSRVIFTFRPISTISLYAICQDCGSNFPLLKTDVCNNLKCRMLEGQSPVEGFKPEFRLLLHQVLGRAWMKDREYLSKKQTGGILTDDMVLDCPRSGPGQVRGIFLGPEPGPLGSVRTLYGPEPEPYWTRARGVGPGPVRARTWPQYRKL